MYSTSAATSATRIPFAVRNINEQLSKEGQYETFSMLMQKEQQQKQQQGRSKTTGAEKNTRDAK